MKQNSVYKHYAAEVSLYSGKTRCYLKYKNIPYQEIVPDRKIMEQELYPRVKKRMIPVLITPENKIIQDTTLIIDYLEGQFPSPPIYPPTPWQRLVGLLLETYGDEWLLMPAMHYRWHYKKDNLGFILREFGEVLIPELPQPLRFLGGIPLAMAFGTSYKFLLGVQGAIIKPLEEWYESFLVQLDEHFKHLPFLLGTRPSIGDFGFIGPLYAHLFRDPYPHELMKRIAPNVVKWVQRMIHPEPLSGEFLGDDEVKETLHPILKRMFQEHVPVLLDTIDRVDNWYQKHPNRDLIPRFIGFHPFWIGGVQGKRQVQPFSQWMFQRPLFFYQQLDTEAKQRIDPILKSLGGYQSMQKKVRSKLDYINHKVTRVF